MVPELEDDWLVEELVPVELVPVEEVVPVEVAALVVEAPEVSPMTTILEVSPSKSVVAWVEV